MRAFSRRKTAVGGVVADSAGTDALIEQATGEQAAAEQALAQEPPATAELGTPGARGIAVAVRGTERGPWDVAEMPELGARLDLGALRIPGRQGMQLRMEMEKSGTRVIAVNLGMEGSALQVQVFAAPRTLGLWDELRGEIAGSVQKQGGTADELTGPFGRELLARLPIRTPEGRTGHRPARFIGIDGPRWFLRGVLTGRAAVDPEAAVELEAVLADVVVVRGGEARAPRDLLALNLPGTAPTAAAAESSQSAPDVRVRGPEITELR